MYIIIILFLVILIFIFFNLKENFSSTPINISMGARWGGVPENLYGDIDYTPYNQLSSIMETTENADFSYGRNMGAGSIGDINKKLNYGLHSQNEVQYV